MILCHIFSDDKFIDAAIGLFEETRCTNRYVCLRDEESSVPYTYIKAVDKVQSIQPKYMSALLQDDSVDVFCFHTLDASRYDYVLQISPRKKIVWFAWGYDLYYPYNLSPAVLSIPLYQPLTSKILGYRVPQQSHFYQIWRPLKRFIKWILFPKQQYLVYQEQRRIILERRQAIELQKKVLQRIDYISTVLKVEYDLLKEYNIIQANFFHFQYGFCIQSLNEPMVNTQYAQYILVGNSADGSNNHFDVVDLLRKRGIKNKLYIPLAYGNTYCRDLLMEQYKDDENIVFQTDFCDKQVYTEQLLKCRAAVFGHLRQQAMGNINICLRYGIKVFLYEDSIAYKYLQQQGFIVYTIEKDLTYNSVNVPMGLEDIQYNRELLWKNKYSVQILQQELDVLQKEIE